MMAGDRALFRLMVPSAGTLCQLLALGLLVETRLELAAQGAESLTNATEHLGARFVRLERDVGSLRDSPAARSTNVNVL